MIQGGDPLSKDESKTAYWGTGGPGYQFPDELSGKEEYTYGTLAMANSGRNTNGSQFFIVSANPRVDLPALYTVFGKVVSGMDVVEKIQNVATDKSNDRPIENVVLKGVVLK
jgi:peptidyl-prolyl cis-trans isomerase A (cyclophilin A)